MAFASLCGATTAETSIAGIIDHLKQKIDPDRAMAHMRTIYSTDRYFDFPAFQKTTRYLAGAMKDMGLESVEIVQPPADGQTQVGFWTMPMAWEVKSARLELVDDEIPEAQRLLADYSAVPSSLGMWSGPTPPGGVIAELVPVSQLELREPGKLDLKGKLVLMDVNPAGYKWLLAKAGALGAVNAFTENPELRDDRQWINAWGDSGWGYTKKSSPLLSFSITPNQAQFLRTLLKKGRVRLKASVDSRLYEGSYPYVTGLLPGTTDEEVLVLAHTSEQGAQDNATGVAASLEGVTALRYLIQNGRLPKPRRGIRVLLMPEMYGSMHYVAEYPERIKRTVAAICVDTPAASYSLAGTEYTFHLNPHVAKDFTDALILKIAAAYFPTVKRPWHEKSFTTGTDTYLAEPMVGIPTVWPYSGSGVETHHNSADTPDDVDPRSLRDLATVTAAYLYAIANAGAGEVLEFARLSETRGYSQILNRMEAMLETVPPAASAAEQIDYIVDRESQAVSSVLRLVPETERAMMATQLKPALARLREFGTQQQGRVKSVADGRETPSSGQRNREAESIVVKRKRFGTLPLDDLPHEEWEGQPSGAWAAVPTIALYWSDGKRNLAEVIRLTELELGPAKFDFVKYFRFLQRRGYVDFVE